MKKMKKICAKERISIVFLFMAFFSILCASFSAAEPSCKAVGESGTCCPSYLTDHGTFFGYFDNEEGSCAPADGLDGHLNSLEWCLSHNGVNKLAPGSTASCEDLFYNGDLEVGENYGFRDSNAFFNYRGSLVGVSALKNGERPVIETNYHDTEGYGGLFASDSLVSGMVRIYTDPSGKALKSVDANGNIVRNYYDGLERLAKTEYYKPNDLQNPDMDVEYFYDEYASSQEWGGCALSGNSFNLLCEIHDNSGKTFFQYDDRGRIVTKAKEIIKGDSEQTYMVSYEYDSADNVVKISLPELVFEGDNNIYYGYNYFGQIETVVHGSDEEVQTIADFTYTPTGTIETKTLNPEAESPSETIYGKYFYDVKDQLKAIYFSKQSEMNPEEVLFERAMDYDSVGNVKTISYDVFESNPLSLQTSNEQFSYDNYYRIMHADYAGDRSFEFTYFPEDVLGDRATKTITGADKSVQTTNYYYDDQMRLLDYSGGTKSDVVINYDNNGNIIYLLDQNGVESSYEYDALNRMTKSVVDTNDGSDPVTTYYVYDYQNMRVKKITDTETTFYLYNGLNVVFEETFQTGFGSYICGDVNSDQQVNVLDILYLIDYKFKLGDEPIPLSSGNVNGDDLVNVLDILYLINYKFKQGAEPVTQPDGTCVHVGGDKIGGEPVKTSVQILPDDVPQTIEEVEAYLADAQARDEKEFVAVKK